MGRETVESKEIASLLKYGVNRKLVDIGARLSGSNAAHLIDEYGFSAVLVDMREKAVDGLRKKYPEGDIRCLQVTPDNANDLVSEDTGVLLIDIDGNDYWVWKAIKATPQIVVIEAGQKKRLPSEDWVAPYDDESKKRLDGTADNPMIELGKEKGYTFYKKISVNLIFLRNDLYEAVHPSA